MLEPLSGYILLAQKTNNKKFNDSWNFGPLSKNERSVEWIIEKIKNWGKGAEWKLDKNNNPHEEKYLKLNISKAQNIKVNLNGN